MVISICAHNTTINIELAGARAHLPTQQTALGECSVDTQLAGDFWVDQLSERHQKEREKYSLDVGRLRELHSTPGITFESKRKPQQHIQEEFSTGPTAHFANQHLHQPLASCKLGSMFKYLCISSLHLMSSSKTQQKGFVLKYRALSYVKTKYVLECPKIWRPAIQCKG